MDCPLYLERYMGKEVTFPPEAWSSYETDRIINVPRTKQCVPGDPVKSLKSEKSLKLGSIPGGFLEKEECALSLI